jgi:hypothetical protein
MVAPMMVDGRQIEIQFLKFKVISSRDVTIYVAETDIDAILRKERTGNEQTHRFYEAALFLLLFCVKVKKRSDTKKGEEDHDVACFECVGPNGLPTGCSTQSFDDGGQGTKIAHGQEPLARVEE